MFCACGELKSFSYCLLQQSFFLLGTDRRIQREEAIEASYMNLDMRDNHSSAKLDASPGAKVVSNSAKTRSPLTDIVFEYDYLELKTDPEILQIVTLQK
ncbi:hypothetical protein V6N13_046769 [Hibiscus sabdariffa]